MIIHDYISTSCFSELKINVIKICQNPSDLLSNYDATKKPESINNTYNKENDDEICLYIISNLSPWDQA